MGSLTKVALICGSASMIILVSILINLPFLIQILLLLIGLIFSAYGVFLLTKIILNTNEKITKTTIEHSTIRTAEKKKRPTSTF